MARRSQAAGMLVTAVVLGSGCLHDWDAYEAPEDGSSSSGGNVAPLCDHVCAVYADCVATDWSDCPADCTAKIADCTGQELENLQTCADEAQADCDPFVAQASWNTCVAFDVPCLSD